MKLVTGLTLKSTEELQELINGHVGQAAIVRVDANDSLTVVDVVSDIDDAAECRLAVREQLNEDCLFQIFRADNN